jgi:hypothetical protein
MHVSIESAVGGKKNEDVKNAQIISGTPGRVLQLAKELSFSTRSIKNDRQQYYMNGKFQDEILAEGGDQYASDGAFYTTNVNNTRFNNEGLFGLTHIFGNAAEMIDIEGVAKGGHWANYPDECGISKSYNYTGPDCRVSVRIFMEVEEKQEPKVK